MRQANTEDDTTFGRSGEGPHLGRLVENITTNLRSLVLFPGAVDVVERKRHLGNGAKEFVELIGG